MNKQEIFDKVVRHLHQQARPSVDKSGNPLYRGPEGTSCAIGCLFTDEEYISRIENQAVQFLDDLPDCVQDAEGNVVGFLSDLQKAHDVGAALTTDNPGWRLVEILNSLASLEKLDNKLVTELMTTEFQDIWNKNTRAARGK